MNGAKHNPFDDLPLPLAIEVNRICQDFEEAWRAGQSPRIEEYVTRATADAFEAALRELVAVEIDLRRAAGESVGREEYHRRFPAHAEAINAAFALIENRTSPSEVLPDTESLLSSHGPETDGATKSLRIQPVLERLGRFQIERQLGRGAFGAVYLARDSELDRWVALKVPHAERFASTEELQAFIEEARTAARLAHPGIVTIFDVARDGEQVFIVQEYVEGQDLGRFLKSQSSPVAGDKSARLMIAIAETLAFAHSKGFVHRDLKPANILLDAQQRPRVADFGLAVHETIQRRRKGERSGTPAYMSPEQVRGETHRLDGRSDLWSLGVILYETLTGRRPFGGETRSELFDEIQYRHPKPPRQIAGQVPAELERICLKCLSKRVTDRYSSALDLAGDLQHWLQRPETSGEPRTSVRGSTMPEAKDEAAPVRIVPKGLRSFDAEDAGFFLDLLPGPRDRDGLPESIRFWKTRLEETDADRTFAVGMIYGPSGCGKSSLVKAGLLPRLAPHVLPVYVEATAGETELRLLKGLRKICPQITPDATLPDIFASLREGVWLPQGRKIVIVLDQFEQWLHARVVEPAEQLIQALRQCDGARLQAVVMVRDDFAMGAARFMDALDVPILQGKNFATVDLFGVDHARNVLMRFGQAFGRLPVHFEEISANQQQFLDAVVAGLAQESKVVSVRLALFAEMVKDKPWTAGTLSEVGGTEGIGVAFLEETFSSRSANPKVRQHQHAARAVLKTLLPEAGTDIKGHMRSYAELLDASAYASRPRDFEDLIRILDSEVRLITPTESEGTGNREPGTGKDAAFASSPSSFTLHSSNFQLTHDYLVPSLREWLTRKQKETRRGRAELRLAKRSALWNAKPENQQLPSWWEYLSIAWLTPRKDWTESQRKMMRRAGRVQGTRAAILAASLVLAMVAGREIHGRFQARSAISQLTSADVDQLPASLRQVDRYYGWAGSGLSALASGTAGTLEERRAQLHARLALVSRDASHVEPLLEELLTNHVS